MSHGAPEAATKSAAYLTSSSPLMPTLRRYEPAADRYESMPYRRAGHSGLQLPSLGLGMWQNFGDSHPLAQSRLMARMAFDAGVTYFDLANNYGVPYGSAEENLGRILRQDFGSLRDELVISTKAGYDMWPGPYGEWGSRKYLIASLDQSLKRLGLDYVDIYYSHRVDPYTPLEETMGALDQVVRQGKALYVGISSYGPKRTAEAAAIMRDLGTPLIVNQCSYSLLNRWVEDELLNVVEDEGMGLVAFSPLAQGLLSDRYLNGIPDDSRVRSGRAFASSYLTEENLEHVRTLNEIAKRRDQTLSQMALAWLLRDPRVSSVLLGVSRPEQLEANLAALRNVEFSQAELNEIDQHAKEGSINLWESSSSAE
jgi:L-glyceraldehyde 3-phosphate reductase